jgi:hypothetical protein
MRFKLVLTLTGNANFGSTPSQMYFALAGCDFFYRYAVLFVAKKGQSFV